MTANRPARAGRRERRVPVENSAYTAFCARIIRAAARRMADGDVEGLADLARLSGELDQALSTAVAGLRDCGYSWAEIASPLGTTRQAAQQRWGRAA
ncbi:MAG TPA: hypothetical protein VK816_00455 [Jatrophihabitantaceae bacterium]|nr:hypothetical protein [Jatrophihabitantaceae bacterium]